MTKVAVTPDDDSRVLAKWRAVINQTLHQYELAALPTEVITIFLLEIIL